MECCLLREWCQQGLVGSVACPKRPTTRYIKPIHHHSPQTRPCLHATLIHESATILLETPIRYFSFSIIFAAASLAVPILQICARQPCPGNVGWTGFQHDHIHP